MKDIRKIPQGYYYGREDDFQVSVMSALRMQYPSKMIIHVPNGGKRSMSEAVRFKKMGVVPGVVDIICFEKNDFYNGCFAELKVFPNRPTKEQLNFMAHLTKQGWAGNVFYNIDSVLDFFDDYFTNQTKSK